MTHPTPSIPSPVRKAAAADCSGVRQRCLRRTRLALAAGLTALLAACGGDGSDAFSAPQHFEGVLSSGGRYVIDVPAKWNGGLYVYSVGYISRPLPASQAPANATDDVTREWLLAQGYALAGSQPVGTGWAVGEILPDQAEIVRTVFRDRTGVAPRRSIAWGSSMGGLISAGLLQRYRSCSTARHRCAHRWRAAWAC